MRLRLSLAFSASVLVGWSGAVAQAAQDVTEFYLDNGMQVVVIEDSRAPAVTHMVWYRTGSADEVQGVSGIAHFVEHLMFKGTDDLESGAFSDIVEANGGSGNAFTSWDYTGYFQRVAADRLGLLMEMEADRMRDLIFVPEEVETERSVILEERAQRVDSTPGAIFNEQMRAALYLNHPYGRPIIGWRHEMEELDIDDARAFYDTYYHPNNAVLIVAGDTTVEEVQRLAEQHYAPIPAFADLPERERPSEPPHLAERRVIYEDARVANPSVSIMMLAPQRRSGAQEDAAAMVFLAQLLGGSGQTSILPRRLQVEEQASLYTSAFYRGSSLDSATFGLVNVPTPGRDLEQAEADLWRIVDEFLAEGVDLEQFERIKFQIEASEIYAQDNVGGLARSYGAALSSGLTVEDVATWRETLVAVTPEDVMTAARTLFETARPVTGYLRRPDAPESVELSQ